MGFERIHNSKLSDNDLEYKKNRQDKDSVICFFVIYYQVRLLPVHLGDDRLLSASSIQISIRLIKLLK